MLLQVDGHSQKTAVKKKTLDPQWDPKSSMFEFEPDPTNTLINLVMMDHDTLSMNDWMGQAKIEPQIGKKREWHKLSKKNGIADGTLGEVELEIEYAPRGGSPNDQKKQRRQRSPKSPFCPTEHQLLH